MAKPNPQTYGTYYHQYVNQVEQDELLPALQDIHNDTQAFIASIPEDKESYAYAEGKWTLKQVVQHIIDTERIFAYRALTFARGDQTELPGYEHNDYVEEAEVNTRTLTDLAREFLYVRNGTLALFSSFSDEVLDRGGVANENPMTVLALGFTIAGHERHHMNVIRTKYLGWK